jgi:hypothetical protein
MNARALAGKGDWKQPLLAALLLLSVLILAPRMHAQDGSQSSAPGANAESGQGSQQPANYAAPMPRGKKLILTDGNYMLVREYERQGDRVRYYSVERSAWEEIPAEMVDWAATEKASAETASSQKERLDRLNAAATSEVARSIDTGSSLMVGSGVFLPDAEGFYVLNGQTVLGLVQSEAVSRLDTSRATLRAISGIPFINTKRFVEVAGKRAKIRLQSAEPEFYIRTSDGRTPQLMLVRAEVQSDKRHLTTAVIDIVGNTKYDQKEIPLLMSEAAHGVQRFVLQRKLEPGEYALLETTKEGLSPYVWDFGVDGTPAASSNSKKTENSKQNKK